MDKEHARKEIDKVLDYFDFEGYAKALQSIKFGWVESEDLYNPSDITIVIGRLRRLGRHLLQRAYEHLCNNNNDKTYTISSGGLTATVDISDNYFHLAGTIEEISNIDIGDYDDCRY